MKKILSSVLVVAVVAVGVVGVATRAFFSDTETSTGNTFQTGAIDLKVDSTAHYGGLICMSSNNEYRWVKENPQAVLDPYFETMVGQTCAGSWEKMDIGGTGAQAVQKQFFNYADIKPGDSGENTVSLHVYNNDAWVCAEVSNLVSEDVNLTEPETEVDPDGLASGELDKAMIWTVWKDNGDNIRQENEPILVSGHPVNGKLAIFDSTTGSPLAGDTTAYLGVSWELPYEVGNEVQTDRLTGDISFYVEQARHNADFTCLPKPTPTPTPEPTPTPTPEPTCTPETYTYIKNAGFADSKVIITFYKQDKKISVEPRSGYAINWVDLDVDGDGYDGYHRYATGPVSHFDPPGNKIRSAKVEVVSVCPQ